jgi:hypothetical protein
VCTCYELRGRKGVFEDARASLLNPRPNALCLMTIEKAHLIVRQIDYEDFVADYASANARHKQF